MDGGFGVDSSTCLTPGDTVVLDGADAVPPACP